MNSQGSFSYILNKDMNTKVVTWNEKEEIIAALLKGEVVCFPTETVYGIAVIATSAEAFAAMVKAKKRSPDKPFTMMCENLGQAALYCNLDYKAMNVMREHFPGELTVLVPPRDGLDPWVNFNSDLIGIRIPKSDEILDLIGKVGAPLLVSSANMSGEKASASFDETYKVFNGNVSLIVKGDCPGQLPSTIVKMDNNGIGLVRQGPIEFSKLEESYKKSPRTIAIGSDHGGFKYKSVVIKALSEKGFKVLDEGTYSTESCDYPIFGRKVGEDVASKKADLGIVICTSGEGISISANKVKGIRCAIGYSDKVTQKSREHNDANVISFGQAYMDLDDVLRRVDIFLLENFSPLEKHHRRVKEIEQ